MKIFIAILIVIASSCHSNNKIQHDCTIDSVRITTRLISYYDSLQKTDAPVIIANETDTVVKIIYVNGPTAANSLTMDSLRHALYNSNFKLQRVKYYLNICLRKPSQDKFLKGWIRRAVE